MRDHAGRRRSPVAGVLLVAAWFGLLLVPGRDPALARRLHALRVALRTSCPLGAFVPANVTQVGTRAL